MPEMPPTKPRRKKRTNAIAAHPGSRTLAVDLRQLRIGSQAYETAHKMDMEHYEKIQRLLGLAVVVLTAFTGTAVVTALATSTNAAAKILIGVLSVLSAVAAALNEKGPFTDQVKLHADKAASFNEIHGKAVDLHRDWARRVVRESDVDTKLKELETSYNDLEKEALGVRNYAKARQWADEHEPPDELLV